ncbi:flavodoxin family protein [Desulfosediminicola ganghwensis]|uniref:flavodoxin family protein n=1 Tax=Desulfosediminicola ganghwensis TaxID=2569540 RepID=UPI0010AB9FC2|nr:flavodoxin family protein [Desulfosediminicola ganghwensis]
MYALAVNGSPRKGGNTEILLSTALEPLQEAGWETELVQVGGKAIRGCLACGKCHETQNMQCIQSKDIFNEIMEKMVRADALILGSPTYFTDVSAEMKALLDRSGYVALANGRIFRSKIGAAVVAVRRAGATHVYDTINHMFLMNQMIIPGSTYWNLGIGRDKGEVRDDAEGLTNMKNLGETIQWLGAAIAPHKETFPTI